MRSQQQACGDAGPWVSNVNCQLHGKDLQTAQSIARAVAEKHGGLPGVQAMALHHEAGMLAYAWWLALM